MQLNSTLWCPPWVISRESLSGKFGVSQCGAFEYYILELPQCLAISGKVELFLHFRDDRKILSVEHCPLCFEKLLSGIHSRKHRFVKGMIAGVTHLITAYVHLSTKIVRKPDG